METLFQASKRLRVDLSPAQLEAFNIYYQELSGARSRANLTSLAEGEAVQRRHFAEPLSLLCALEDAGAFGSPAIDVGTGAGFPGLPIKIVRPQLQLTLLEATGKKVDFLECLIEKLRLRGVTVIHARAEELGHDPAHRAAYQLALARAVAPLPVLVELALPFLRVGGYLATPKGSGAPREARRAAAALAACGGQVERIQPLDLPGAGPIPALVLVRKVAPTPERFPRRPGMPAKRPL